MVHLDLARTLHRKVPAPSNATNGTAIRILRFRDGVAKG